MDSLLFSTRAMLGSYDFPCCRYLMYICVGCQVHSKSQDASLNRSPQTDPLLRVVVPTRLQKGTNKPSLTSLDTYVRILSNIGFRPPSLLAIKLDTG